MHFKSIAASLVLFAVAATAVPNNPVTSTVTVTAPQPTQTTVSQCNTGNAVCCNVVNQANSNAVTSILGLLGISLGDITGLVGLGCTAISVVDVGQSTCNQQAACCTNVEFNGLVNVGCTPLNL